MLAIRRRLCLLVALMTSPANSLRKVLVTGANKGIGKQICARILADVADSFVYLGARDAGRGAAAVASIIDANPAAAGRVELLEMDTTDDASVAAAAAKVDGPLHGLCNNAGVGFGRSIEETLAPNYYGAKRVCAHFLPLVDKADGRVCNIGSASAPNFVSGLGDPSLKAFFTSSETSLEDLEKKLDEYSAAPDYEGVAYGLSKASLHVLTMQLQKAHPSLFINTCSPGYVLTDLTAGMGASKTPEQSNCHVAPLHILFGDDVAHGWYYGSDAVRSPLDIYRGPGEPPYESDTW